MIFGFRNRFPTSGSDAHDSLLPVLCSMSARNLEVVSVESPALFISDTTERISTKFGITCILKLVLLVLYISHTLHKSEIELNRFLKIRYLSKKMIHHIQYRSLQDM
jgi:hypothetical protein